MHIYNGSGLGADGHNRTKGRCLYSDEYSLKWLARGRPYCPAGAAINPAKKLLFAVGMPNACSHFWRTTNETDYFSVSRYRNRYRALRVVHREGEEWRARVTIRSTPLYHQSCRATFVTESPPSVFFFSPPSRSGRCDTTFLPGKTQKKKKKKKKEREKANQRYGTLEINEENAEALLIRPKFPPTSLLRSAPLQELRPLRGGHCNARRLE